MNTKPALELGPDGIPGAPEKPMKHYVLVMGDVKWALYLLSRIIKTGAHLVSMTRPNEWDYEVAYFHHERLFHDECVIDWQEIAETLKSAAQTGSSNPACNSPLGGGAGWVPSEPKVTGKQVNIFSARADVDASEPKGATKP